MATVNDYVLVQPSNSAIVGAGLGDDVYLISPTIVGAGQIVTIDDASGNNKIELVGGLSITKSVATKNIVKLYLSNGAEVTVYNANNFSFGVGANSVAGVAGTTKTFSELLTGTLGYAAVPTTDTPVEANNPVVISGGGGGGGITYTLTAGADIKSFVEGNDTITGALGTLTSIDVLTDASTADADSLTASISGAAAANKPVLTNIETINLDFKGFGVVFDAASTTNGTIVASTTQDGNTSATINNAGATTKVQVGTGITTLNLASSATTLNLTGGQTFSLNNNATAGTMAFASNGATANTITYDAAAVKPLAVSGSQSLTIKTSDVADFVGNTVTNTLSAGTLTLEVTGTATGSGDLSKIAASTFNLNTTGTQNLTLASNAVLKLSKDIGASTIGLTTDGTSDVLNITAVTSQALTEIFNNFETINFVNGSSTPATFAGITVTNASYATQINLSGSQNVTITALTGATNGTTLDASGMASGTYLTATLAATAATVVGSAGNDVITGGAANDLLVGGTGNDTLASGATAGATLADTIIGGEGNDTITWASAGLELGSLGSALANGGAGTDTLTFSSTAAATLTGKVIDIENVNVANTVGAVAWTLADTDLTAGSTLVFTLEGGASTSVLTLNGAAEKDAYLNLSITNNSANVITGGALNDTITLLANTKANVITGGKGVDSVTTVTGATVTLSFAAGDSGVTTATADELNKGAAGDILKFTSITTTVATAAVATSSQLGTGWTVTAATGIATKVNSTLADFVTAATTSASSGATGMNGQAVAYVSGADTWVFYAGTDTASNTDDGLVKLAGLVITDLTGAYGAAGTFTLA